MKQISSPEDFLIGKTIVSTNKAYPPYGPGDMSVVSFIFNDNTFAVYYCTSEGLKFSPRIETDVERHANYFEDGTKRKDPYGLRAKVEYAKFLWALGVYPEAKYRAYEKELEIKEVESEIKRYEDALPTYESNLKKLKELQGNENSNTEH